MNKRVPDFLFLIAVISLIGGGVPAVALQFEKEGNPMVQYTFPSEEKTHEGTWLTWPHHYTYGKTYRNEIEAIWLEMVYALHTGENVHIVTYNEAEKKRIIQLLEAEETDMSRIDFVIAKSDDVWVRDTGPMFVFDENGSMVIADFAFDGWGGKTPHQNDDGIPAAVAAAKSFPIISVSAFVLEGGSVELDGNGTAMLCKSSVVSKNRNPNMSIRQAETYLTQYLGVTDFIWLEGVTDEDITDAHIDGMARFYDDTTLLTITEEDFYELYEGILPDDYETLLSAQNSRGETYKIITFPMTAKNVNGLDYKGSYLNYYVGNKVILLPVYGDKNDVLAEKILSELYTNRRIVPIDVTSLYQYGGMLHCVTQQQPYQPL